MGAAKLQCEYTHKLSTMDLDHIKTLINIHEFRDGLLSRISKNEVICTVVLCNYSLSNRERHRYYKNSYIEGGVDVTLTYDGPVIDVGLTPSFTDISGSFSREEFNSIKSLTTILNIVDKWWSAKSAYSETDIAINYISDGGTRLGVYLGDNYKTEYENYFANNGYSDMNIQIGSAKYKIRDGGEDGIYAIGQWTCTTELYFCKNNRHYICDRSCTDHGIACLKDIIQLLQLYNGVDIHDYVSHMYTCQPTISTLEYQPFMDDSSATVS